MRYIDIEQFQPSADWQARAQQALDELREEINQAESAAIAASQDPVVARKAAISAGLKIKARQDLWRELADGLAALANKKCWYSESLNPGSDKNVDHFRPKGRVLEDDSHEGYWWLAFSWRNFRYACQWCNQRRNDRSAGTQGGKMDHFPLLAGSFRARQETDDHDREEVELLDPIDPEDWKLITYRPDGHPIPSRPQGTIEHARAATSIKIFHLHCKEFVDDRRPLAGSVQRIVEEMERLRPKIGDPTSRAFYKRLQKDLLRIIHKSRDYSAAALAYARAQIYKLELGHQAKRTWLEEILNSNP